MVAFVKASASSNQQQQQEQQEEEEEEEEEEAGGGSSGRVHSSGSCAVTILRCHWQSGQSGGSKAEQSMMRGDSEANEEGGRRECVGEAATAVVEGPWDIADLSFYKASRLFHSQKLLL